MRIFCLVVVMFAACGSSQGTVSGSGVDKTKTIAALDDAEKAAVCDWANGLVGGYGQPIVCDGNTVDSTDANQAECVQGFPTCGALVSDYEACLTMFAANACSDTGIASASASAACQAAADCF